MGSVALERQMRELPASAPLGVYGTRHFYPFADITVFSLCRFPAVLFLVLQLFYGTVSKS